jgi:hypothetical protein
MQELMNICSAFGLSGAAGLNAYIPLLTVAIMQNRHVISLAKPYDVMGEWWVIAILALLLAVELVVDKVPGADHMNDLIHTAIRPAAGALIFASQMGHVQWVHPAVWVVVGLLMSGGVHAGKAVSRPIVNVGTAGIGAPVVSAIENVVSATLSIVAIVAPVVAVILLVLFGWMLVGLFRKFFGGWRKERRVCGVPVVLVEAAGETGAETAGHSAAAAGRWGGGV